MSRAEQIFNIAIRIVFVFAFGAFLWASLPHIATFYHNFEPDTVSWTSSYALAISVDGTALMLTIGMMFFSKNKPLLIKIFVWCFIIALTGFSWSVNWEYAKRFQSLDLTSDPFLLWLNPILASSFAFLNLAYSIVAELFSSEGKTVEQLQAEIDAIDARSGLEKELQKRQGPGFIQQAKNKAIEIKEAVKEVVKEDVKAEDTLDKNTTSEIPKDNGKPEPTTDPLLPIDEEIKDIKDEVVDMLEEEDNPLENKRISEPLESLIEYPKDEDIDEDIDDVQEEKADSKIHFTATSFPVLKSYPKTYSWLSTSQKTATINEIIEVTGHSKKMISNRLKDGTLKTSGRNPELVRISSVIEWLNIAPVPQQNESVNIVKSESQELVTVS